MTKKKSKLDDYVTGRADVHQDQHADVFEDRRTRRNRDRSAQNRTAIERSGNDE